jgi:predicted nucleic acid-binding protein
MEGLPPPEVLLCDTSYVGHARLAALEPSRYAHWPREILDRIRNAVLAISVITIAEERAGEIYRNWGQRLVEEAGERRKRLTWVPLDLVIVERWAQLDAELKRSGQRAVDDNDLWICATAIAHDLVLVTCDKPQSEVPGLQSPIYLPPHAE